MDAKSLKQSFMWRKTFGSSSTSTESKLRSRKPSTPTQIQRTEINSLERKYGRPSKVLSDTGAGGSVLLITRQHDNTTFAVKRFSRRQRYEDEQSYARKIIAEYYIGARLRHTNIIKTLDLFEEHGVWLAVMEYAPYCLFDRVMSRHMSTAEITCSFMQILAGVDYLHRAGFAHRDLKLENVVTTENGIMKLIDFGSAIICKEPGRKTATGLVGSVSYMAPEAAAAICHDPQKADVWSLAIIYYCMVVGRFPWRTPDRSNEAFTLFAAMESPKTPPTLPNPPSRASSTNSVTVINVSITENGDGDEKITEKVLGSWGLLRQLPCESRDVIKAMLIINPSKRPTLQELRNMPWIADARHCAEDVDGKCAPVEGHQHC